LQNTPSMTLRKLSPSTTYIERQEVCLAITLYHESRGEGYRGMLMVGSTVLNRKKSSDKPICAIVKRWYKGYKPKETIEDTSSYKDALAISKGLISGTIAINTKATHFIAKKRLTKLPKWAYTLRKVGKYKQHTFYKEEQI
jgi:spore germination cell wall hydrolase CwlJ-like protein